jgi:predicted RNA methylase
MKIDAGILEIIERGRSEGTLYYLPEGQLDRPTYVAVNKVLECLGGKWMRGLKAHAFETDISDRIDDVLLTGEVIDQKKEFQFFETPPDIIAKMIKLADVQPGHLCLEPSAGNGAIAEELGKIAGHTRVVCWELDPKNVRYLKEHSFCVNEGDFLLSPVFGRYDRIVMNPPFTKQQDVFHVLKALEFLKPDGILVSVMSAGVTFRANRKTLEFWETVKRHEYEVITLDPGAFKVSGTMVNTVILKVTK